MHRLSMTAIVGMLAVTASGCGAGGTQGNKAAVQPTAKSTTLVKYPLPVADQKPIVMAQIPQSAGFDSVGLIESTNINQRVKQLQLGRSDPFARIPTPQVQVVETQQSPQLPEIPVVQELQPAVTQPAVTQPVAQQIPPPSPPPLQTAPSKPDLAEGVVVRGVVEIGDESHAIVKLPNEVTSRAVSEGKRFADNQLIVKRIEAHPSSEPLVVFEQNGIEVAKAVEEEPAKPEPNRTTQSATFPTAPPTNNPLPVEALQNTSRQPQTPETISSQSPTRDLSVEAEFESGMQTPTTAISVSSTPATSSSPVAQPQRNLPPEPSADAPSDSLAASTSSAASSNSQANQSMQKLMSRLRNSSPSSSSSSSAIRSDSKPRLDRQQLKSQLRDSSKRSQGVLLDPLNGTRYGL